VGIFGVWLTSNENDLMHRCNSNPTELPSMGISYSSEWQLLGETRELWCSNPHVVDWCESSANLIIDASYFDLD